MSPVKDTYMYIVISTSYVVLIIQVDHLFIHPFILYLRKTHVNIIQAGLLNQEHYLILYHNLHHLYVLIILCTIVYFLQYQHFRMLVFIPSDNSSLSVPTCTCIIIIVSCCYYYQAHDCNSRGIIVQTPYIYIYKIIDISKYLTDRNVLLFGAFRSTIIEAFIFLPPHFNSLFIFLLAVRKVLALHTITITNC